MIEKFTIEGEVFPFERRYSLAEGIELEQGLGMTFGEWDAALTRGSMKALGGLIWLVLKRNGRDVALADILSGEHKISYNDLNIETPDDGDPTGDPSSPPTGGDTSGSSPSISDTGPPTSTLSPSSSSTT